MELTHDDLIRGIIDEVKLKGTIMFVEDDLFNTFLDAREIEKPLIGEPPSKYILADFYKFKFDLLKGLEKDNIYYITGPDDYIRMFSIKQMYDDYRHVDEIRNEINNLEFVENDVNRTKEEREKAAEKQFELYDDIRSILLKWKKKS